MHETVIYSHSDVNFENIGGDYDTWGAIVKGNVIGYNNINITHVQDSDPSNDPDLNFLLFYYSDRSINGDLPPGFEYLCGADGVLSRTLNNWQEE